MRLAGLLLDLLYPLKCPFCGRVLERGEDGMCECCAQTLPWTGAGERTVDCCDGCLSPLWYRDGVRSAVHRYKFNGAAVHARLLGALMARCLKERWGEPLELITWVPLSAKGLKKRGYDQAELLARRVGELTGLPVEPTLVKVRQTKTQSRLDRESERRANVLGAYRSLPEARLEGRRVLLVDDVVTSGASLSECAACLRLAGAAGVTALTLARAK